MGVPAYSAMRTARLVASASKISGRVSACARGSVRPSASACRTSRSIASPFSACTITRPPVAFDSCSTRRNWSSVTISTPR